MQMSITQKGLLMQQAHRVRPAQLKTGISININMTVCPMGLFVIRRDPHLQVCRRLLRWVGAAALLLGAACCCTALAAMGLSGGCSDVLRRRADLPLPVPAPPPKPLPLPAAADAAVGVATAPDIALCSPSAPCCWAGGTVVARKLLSRRSRPRKPVLGGGGKPSASAALVRPLPSAAVGLVGSAVPVLARLSRRSRLLPPSPSLMVHSPRPEGGLQ